MKKISVLVLTFITMNSMLFSQNPAHLWRSGSEIADYATIQEAIDASQDGDQVLVDAGTYVEQLTITTGITLQGAGRDLTIVQSPPKASLAISGGNWKNIKGQNIYAIIGVKATNDVTVIIKDLKVDGDNQGYAIEGSWSTYDFQGIGIYNTTTTVNNVHITQIRGLASEEGNTPPADQGYPADQPISYNHNTGIFAESAEGAGEHTLTMTNSYVNKFQKTGIYGGGPTLTVDINNNIVEGYGKTLYCTSNGMQISSVYARAGTKGSVKNNQFLEIGFFPLEGTPVTGWGGSTNILLWEAADGFVIEGNTITRSEYLPSWHSHSTSNPDEGGGFTNVGINVNSVTNVDIRNNTITNFDEGAIAYKSSWSDVIPNLITTGNNIYNCTFEYRTSPGNDEFNLNSSYPEDVAYSNESAGIDEIYNFGSGDRIYVNDHSIDGCVNGLVDGSPSIDFTDGTITYGTNGENMNHYSIELVPAGSDTYLLIETDGDATYNRTILLKGEYSTSNFNLNGGYIEYKTDADPPVFENSTPSVSTITETGCTLSADIDEAGTIYYVVVANGATAPSSAEVKAGTGSGGSGQITSGSQTVSSGNFSHDFLVAGLTANTTYDIYVIAEDDESTRNLQANPEVVSSITALPVELTSFTALQYENAVKLLWETATEVNNYGFEIERQKSENGTQNSEWMKIGFVEGYGNSSSPKHYSYLDESLSEYIGQSLTDDMPDSAQYRLKQIDTDGSYTYYSQLASVELTALITSIKESQLPTEFALEQNYPNPFNPSTTIEYSIPVVDALSLSADKAGGVEVQNITLKVYDILGNEVATLVNEVQQPGYYKVKFDAEQLSSGVYVYRIKTDGFVQSKKMILVK